MPVEPETSIVASFSAGRAAFLGNQAKASNPFISDTTAAGQQQRIGWDLGFGSGADDAFVADPTLFAPRYRTVQRILTAAQVAALFSTPLDLLPDTGDSFIRPVRFAFAKEAGTAWTLNTSTRVAVQWKNGSFTEVGGAATAGFMDQAGALKAAYVNGPGTSAGPSSNVAASVLPGIFGKGLRVTNDVANMSGGTGRLLVRVMYEDWPSAFWSF